MKGRRLSRIVAGFCVVMALALVLPLISACAKPAATTPTPAPKPAPAPTATPTPTPTPAPKPTPKEVIAIKFGSHIPATGAMSKAMDWYMTQVETRSGGRVKFERYWSESLAPATQMGGALSSGAADSGYLIASYQPSKLPLLMVGHLPTMVADIYPSARAVHDLYQQVPAMMDELVKLNARPMAYIAWSANLLLTTKPVNALNDLKGMKIRVMGDQAQVAKALGAVPVDIATPEVNDAMSKGTIDGGVLTASGVTNYGLQNVGKYFWQMPFGGAVALMAINQKVWDKLPADIQQIMTQVDLEFPEPLHRMYQIEGEEAALAVIKAAGVKVTAPTPEEIAKMRQVARDVVWTNWAKDVESKGLPGQKVLDTISSLTDKYAASSPFKR